LGSPFFWWFEIHPTTRRKTEIACFVSCLEIARWSVSQLLRQTCHAYQITSGASGERLAREEHQRHLTSQQLRERGPVAENGMCVMETPARALKSSIAS
jgi:hypothetical protein